MIKTNRLISCVILAALLVSGIVQQTWAAESNSVVNSELCRDLMNKGGVFVFFDPSCPICAEYFPTLEQLTAKYKGKLDFFLVFKAEDSSAVKGFVDGYQPHSRVLCDKNSLLLAQLRPKVTPEVFVVQQKKVVYSGRIDDRYAAIGHRRNVIRSHDLDEALALLAAGRQAREHATTAVGCYIESAAEDVQNASK
jgi:hypothetical protein